ncbi:hypothetical protein Poli38472_000100 [Pythium oligandrum]|uniref:Uncharacterized protein n=1 Tax=Pythium oligandrum TaxID=41045 RepID=A0A8K1FIS7_PYTOL|nr:hypothetical protein Poli38472_000100 [Pythium oligandrum]|eukprot:TMW60058.1 hypothetical protein Poli38472_000100 [Pythium oligandrum]
MDDPLCNVPNADSTGSVDGAMTDWRTCRADSAKMRALETATLYGGDPPLLMAAMDGRIDSIEWLLEEGMDVNTRGRGGATALHTAALTPAGSPALQLLLASSADPNSEDEFGFTPLHRLIQSGNVEGATLLLSSGANLTISAPGEETPLHLAAYENAREMAQLLLAFGADPFARNDRGVTSFEVGLFDMSVPPHHMT